MELKRNRFAYTVTEVFLMLALSVYLLFPGLHGYTAIEADKVLLFYLLFGGYLLVMAGYAAYMVLFRGRSAAQLWYDTTMAQRFVILYLVFTAVSSLLSAYSQWTFFGMSRYEGLLTIGLYCGCCLCVSRYAPTSGRLWRVFGVAMTLFCILCFLHMAGLDPLDQYPDGMTYADGNVLYAGIYLGTVGNAGLVAGLLCLAIPVFAVRAIASQERGDRLLFVVCALCLIVLIGIDIKAGLLGLAVGSIVSLPAVLPVSARVRKCLWLCLPVAAAIFAVCILLFAKEGVLYEAGQLLRGNWDDAFGSGRIYIWKQVLHRCKGNLLFGTGPDTMIAAQIPGFDFDYGGGTVMTVADTAHNEYLNVLYHQGVFSLIAYLGALISAYVCFLRTKTKSVTARALCIALTCYCVQAFFGISSCLTTAFFWLFLGIFVNETRRKIK